MEQEIAAVRIEAADASRMEVESDSPGLSLLRRYFDGTGEFFEVELSIYPADRFTFRTELTRTI